MTTPWSLLSSVLALATLGLAQGRLITPPHAVDMEGNSSSGVTFTAAKTRTQQIDRNLIGTAVTAIRSLAFRRSNSSSRTGSTARTADLRLDLGFGVAAPTSTFDGNFLGSSRQTVYPAKSFNLPDWTGPTTTPAPFDLVIPFATPFVYDNTKPLVWDLQVDNGSGGGTYYMDWMPTTPRRTRGDTPTVLGTGCTTANGVFRHASIFSASTNQIMLDWDGANAPANAVVLLTLGLSDPDLAIGWCSRLRTDLAFLMPSSMSNGMGVVSNGMVVPWGNGLAGVRLYTQMIAADASKPGGLALSNGIQSSSPYVKAGGGSAVFKIHRIYDAAAHGPTGTGPSTTPAPVRFMTN